MSAGAVHEFGSYDRTNFALAASVIALVYYIYTLLLPMIPAIGAIIMEVILMIFWLSSFAAVADVFGSVSCSYRGYYYSYVNKGCKYSKAFIAFGVLSWVLSILTVALLVWKAIVPMYRTGGMSALTEKLVFSKGCLLLSAAYAPSRGPVLDLEPGLGGPAEVASGDDSMPEHKAETLDPEPHVSEPTSPAVAHTTDSTTH